jgi:hypothetical protein
MSKFLMFNFIKCTIWPKPIDQFDYGCPTSLNVLVKKKSFEIVVKINMSISKKKQLVNLKHLKNQEFYLCSLLGFF